MTVHRTARDRARAELTREIVAAAGRQLAEVGAAGLSLRAVSRELGMVSSALHRYFPTRDDLLTALIVAGYDGIGAAVEDAAAAVDPDDHGGRWMAMAAAIRSWALAHPHEYALVYGSPVPGYRAPRDTVASAERVTRVLIGVLVDAHAAGALDVPQQTAAAPLHEDVERLRAWAGAGLPDEVLLRAVTAWTGLFGHVGFELFGQFDTVLHHRDELFIHTAVTWGHLVGLRGLPEVG